MTQKDENYLLQEICRNSGMGVAAINQVLKDVYDEEFAYELNVQADKMEQFARKAGIRLRENGSEPSEPKPIATAMLVTAIRMKQALQNRTEDVADLIGKEMNEVKRYSKMLFTSIGMLGFTPQSWQRKWWILNQII